MIRYVDHDPSVLLLERRQWCCRPTDKGGQEDATLRPTSGWHIAEKGVGVSGQDEHCT